MPHIDLLELAPFADIPLSDVVSLIDAMAPRQWSPSSDILIAGERPPGLLVVTAGTVVQRTPTAQALIEAPVVLPVAAFFAQRPVAVSVQAASLVSAFCLPWQTFERLLLARHPALLRFLANLLALGEGLHGCKTLG